MVQNLSKITLRTTCSAQELLRLGWCRHTHVYFTKRNELYIVAIRQHYHSWRGKGGKVCHLGIKWFAKRYGCFGDTVAENINEKFYNEIMADIERVIDKCKGAEKHEENMLNETDVR